MPRSVCLLLLLAILAMVAIVAADGATPGDDSDPATRVSVGYVFETYTPYALQRFFEFSDQGWNISAPCLRDMYAYLQALRRALPWAVRLYDASAYYAGGIYGSTLSLRLHRAQLCRQLRDSRDSRSSNASTPPFPLQLLLADYEVRLGDAKANPRPVLVQQQLCLPHSCRSGSQLSQILEPVSYTRNHLVRGQRLLQLRLINDDFQPWRSTHFRWCLLYVSLASGYYAILQLLRSRQQEPKPEPEQKKSPQQLSTLPHSLANLWRRKFLLHSLKLLRLTPGVYKRAENAPKTRADLCSQFVRDNCLEQAIRHLNSDLDVDGAPQSLLLLLWTLLWTLAQLQAQLGASVEPPSYLGYLMDVYFLLCGCQLARLFLSSLPQQPLEVKSQLLHLCALLARRLLGWAPLYGFAQQLAILLDLHLRHNVLLAPPSLDHLQCVRQPLWQLLYIDCYMPLLSRCMPWIWPLSLELQLYVAASLLLLLAAVQPRYAALIGSALYALSLMAGLLWQWQYQAKEPKLEDSDSDSLEQQLAVRNLVLPNISLRVAAYLLGLCLGFLLRRSSGQAINVYLLASGWLAAALVAGFALFGYHRLRPLLTPLLRAGCAAAAHTYANLLLLWLLLSWRRSSALPTPRCLCAAARLTPVCVLLAPLLIRLIFYAPDTRLGSGAVDASLAQLLLLSLGLCCLLYVAAALIYLLLAAPLLSLLGQLAARLQQQQQQQSAA